MPVDFQVAFPQDTIKLGLVSSVPNLPVRTLDVIGEDFRSVSDVLINQIPSPDVVILSKTRLLAQVPDSLSQTAVTSITVTSTRFTITDRSLIKFQIGRTPSKTRGILRLVQLFLKILFTTAGTDVFAPKIGGGGLRSIGELFGKDEGGDIISTFIISVDNTARQVIQIQARNQTTPPDEKLLTANVISAGFNRNETALLAGIEVVSQAGKAATARLEF